MPQLFLTNALTRQIGQLPSARNLLWGLEAGVIERAWRTAAARDPDAASRLGARLGRWFGPRSAKHKHVVANLRTVFPDWLPHQAEAMARRVWANIGRTLIEFPMVERICDPHSGRVRIIDLGGIEHVVRSGRPGIFVAGHLANWNLIPLAAAREGLPLSVVYRRMSNPIVERLFEGWRDAIGCRFLEVEQATRPLLRELQAGRSIGLLMDQRYDRGVKVPFFGRPATTTVVPARLSLKLGLPLIPVRVQRLTDARFVLTVYRPIEPDAGCASGEAAELRLTRAVNALFERWIAAAPDQWLCTKRRWPRERLRRPRRGKISTT